MMNIEEEREAFEKVWTDGNGHFRFFEFDQDACKYRLNGITDNLPKEDLLSASITLNTAWLFWLGAKKQAVPEGFVLVPKENITHFYQDNDEPENCCLDASGFDSLGDCIDDGEVMLVNKFTQANISKQQMFGAWCACDPKPLTRFIKEFKLFDTQEEAEKAMIEAWEQKG